MRTKDTGSNPPPPPLGIMWQAKLARKWIVVNAMAKLLLSSDVTVKVAVRCFDVTFIQNYHNGVVHVLSEAHSMLW